MARPAQLVERDGIDVAPVIDREVPVAVGSKVSPSPRPTQADRLGIGETPACVNDHVDTHLIGHTLIVPGEPTVSQRTNDDVFDFLGSTVFGLIVNSFGSCWLVRSDSDLATSNGVVDRDLPVAH
jgi:hypothetical protein